MNAAPGWRRDKKHLLRSCESCRFSKTKCIPHDMPDEKCQRCARLDKYCVFSQGRDRKKRGTPSQTRILDVEKKIDSIYSLLQNGSVPQGGLVSQPPETLTPQSLTPGESSLTSPSRGASPNTSYIQNSSHCFEENSGITDAIQMGLVTFDEAENLLKNALSEYGHFPWVVVPSQVTLEQFRRERPSLLLSLLALASRRRAIIRESLEREFKKTVSAKVVMDGSPDVDLLQGLLVYLAWFHLYPNVQEKKHSTLAQLAVAISVDLDLPKLIAGENNSRLKVELERTYVGVYYMTSCISMGARKPFGLRYDDYIGDCCRSLVQSNYAPTDTDLIYFVGLQRLGEEIAITFGYDSINNESRHLSMENVDLFVKAFKSRLLDLRSSFPLDSKCFSSMTLAYEKVNVYLYEVSLHMDHSFATSPGPLGREASHQRRTSLLLSCLDATKSYLDCYLRVPPEEIVIQSTLEKGELAYATGVLMKIALCGNSGFDAVSLRQACNVSHYLDALAEHLGKAATSANIPDDAGCPDSFSGFKTMAERLKGWYESTEFFESTGTTSTINSMSALQFVEIAKQEPLINFDLGNMDFSFLETSNILT